MSNINRITTSPYQSLEEIERRKDKLRDDMDIDNDQIKALWNDLVHNPDITSNNPSKRVSALMNTGVGIIDGLILGWKIYRKFNGSRLFRKL